MSGSTVSAYQHANRTPFIKELFSDKFITQFSKPEFESLLLTYKKYVQMSSKLSRAFQEKSQEISLCSIILNLAEDTNVVLEQKATYPANMFISDIGGSAGLILGISFLSIIKLSIQGWDKPYIIQLLVIVIYY